MNTGAAMLRSAGYQIFGSLVGPRCGRCRVGLRFTRGDCLVGRLFLFYHHYPLSAQPLYLLERANVRGRPLAQLAQRACSQTHIRTKPLSHSSRLRLIGLKQPLYTLKLTGVLHKWTDRTTTIARTLGTRCAPSLAVRVRDS